MSDPKIMPPAEYLRECLDYNPETGELTWKIRPRKHFALERIWKRWNTMHAGTPAGIWLIKGNCRIGLAGSRKSFATHRVIWKIMTGQEPVADIDHIDGNPRNNRWSNLRAATKAENQWNKVSHPETKFKRPYQGVYQSPGEKGWWSSIRANGIKYHLGTFPTKEEAAAAYDTAARKLHGEFFPSRPR